MSPEKRSLSYDSPTENPACPEHATYMVPHKFEIWEINRPVEKGFRCANLTCGIIYIEGDRELTQLDYIARLRPLWTLDNFEFNSVPFVQGFVSLAYDSRVVDKYIWTVPADDEAVAFRIIKPFDYTLHL